MLFLVRLSYGFHYILLQHLCLQRVISDNFINDVVSFCREGCMCDDYIDILLFYISVKFNLQSSCSWSQHCAASKCTTVNPLHFFFFQEVWSLWKSMSWIFINNIFCSVEMCASEKKILTQKQNKTKTQHGFPV